MKKEIREYIKKVLEVGADIKENDALIIYMPEEMSDIEKIILELKEEYKIAEIIFIKTNYEKLYNFLSQNPTDTEILKFIETYPLLKQTEHIKKIYFNDGLSEHCPYYRKIFNNYYDTYVRYLKINHEHNKDFFEQISPAPYILSSCPSKSWTLELFNDKTKINELWKLITKTIPSVEEFKKINQQQQKIAKYLNELKINSLHFYTDKGTDFDIKLTKYAKWITYPKEINQSKIYSNFPSYEIYTAPNYLSAEGKIILTKPSIINGCDKVYEATLIFSKGKAITCESNNETWNRVVLNKPNSMYRIGEIALVPNDTPISKLNQTFGEILLDENTGCHIALGDSLDECITTPKELLKTKGKKYYKFNVSEFHQDLTFGDETICVEATSKGKTRTLIRNGNWQL